MISLRSRCYYDYCYQLTRQHPQHQRLILRRLLKMSSVEGGQDVKNYSDDGSRKEHIELTSSQTRDVSTIVASIHDIKQLSPTIKGFTLKVSPGSGHASFKAGQWVDFFIPGLEKIGGFSMCSEPEKLSKESLLDLAIKFSTWPPAFWLHTKAEIGSQVMMRVGGDYHYPNAVTDKAVNGHNLLLIAGGVGINPLASILRQVASSHQISKTNCASKVHLLYSASKRNELIFREDFDRICRENADVTTRYFVTKEDTHFNDVTSGRPTTSHLAEAVNQLADKPTFCYICGPTPMIQSIESQLLSLGLSKNNIFYELWW